MFWKLTVSFPCVQGKIRIKTNGSGHRYVEYEVGRNYDKEKKNVPTRKTIDFLTMKKYQNENWYVFFLSTDSRYVYDDGNSRVA